MEHRHAEVVSAPWFWGPSATLIFQLQVFRRSLAAAAVWTTRGCDDSSCSQPASYDYETGASDAEIAIHRLERPHAEVMILLLLGSLARFRHLLGRAQIKED